MYNYSNEMKKDVINAIGELILNDSEICMIEDTDALIDELEGNFWNDDSVTGNASGSYFCNSYKAAEALQGNEWIAEEAAESFGIDSKTMAKNLFNYEYWDVIIRCYLLPGVIFDVVAEIETMINNYGDIETLADAIEMLKAA